MATTVYILESTSLKKREVVCITQHDICCTTKNTTDESKNNLDTTDETGSQMPWQILPSRYDRKTLSKHTHTHTHAHICTTLRIHRSRHKYKLISHEIIISVQMHWQLEYRRKIHPKDPTWECSAVSLIFSKSIYPLCIYINVYSNNIFVFLFTNLYPNNDMD